MKNERTSRGTVRFSALCRGLRRESRPVPSIAKQDAFRGPDALDLGYKLRTR